ncbi:site-2 protease family protein [Clostridium tepidiprofundi]|nr:site-2 protease family protein [Clostridium tepidiprofundi]
MELFKTVLMIPAILIAFTFHEFAHAWMADRLGDKTPKLQGRLSLNPFVHIDIIGFIMILLFKFGWAKPVQINPSAYKNYYKDDLKVSIAGPLANFFIAVVFVLISVVFYFIKANNSVITILSLIVEITISLNCVLFFLNLMPIPGFDGFHILRDLFPKFFLRISDNLNRYGFIIFIIFIMPILPGQMAVFDYLVGIPANLLEWLLKLPVYKMLGMI